MKNFFERFKKHSPVEKLIHDLSLKAVCRFLKSEKKFLEISDSQEFFSELKVPHLSLNQINKLPEKVDTILLHTPTDDGLQKIISRLKNKEISRIVILEHNKHSLDFWLMKLAYKLDLTEENPDQHFLDLNEVTNLIGRNNFGLMKITGSFFIPKMLLIFLPNNIQVALYGLLKFLDNFFSESWFKFYFARNHIVFYQRYSDLTKARIDSIYTSTALNFDEKYNQNTWVGKMYFRNIDKLMKLLELKPGDKLLDIGCGTGNYSIVAAKVGTEVTGIDISSEMLALAKKKAEKEKVKVNFIKTDAEKMNLKANYFDKVVTASVPQVVNDLDVLVKEISRVLKPDGYAVIHIVNPFSLAGIETIILKFLHFLPPVRIITPSSLRKIASRHDLIYRETLGIEFHQGLPIPWKWRWMLIKKIDGFEKKISLSPLSAIAAQQYIKFKKI